MYSQEVVKDALTAIQKRNKGKELLPEMILDEAKQPTHVLHGYFLWDDTQAAHRYRVEQARALIRSVRVVVVREEKNVRVPAFVSRSSSEVSGYLPIEEVMDNKVLSLQALVAECKAVIGHLKRARGIAIALGLEGKFDRMIAMVTRTTKQIEAEHVEESVPMAASGRS